MPRAAEAGIGEEGRYMFRRRMVDLAHLREQRSSGSVPMVVDIDLSDPMTGCDARAPLPDRGWLESSRDLLRGVSVRETPMDALPADLVDVFKRPRR
jgi:hypothetical protein